MGKYTEAYNKVKEQNKENRKKERELKKKALKEQEQERIAKVLSDSDSLYKLLDWSKKSKITTSHTDGTQENRTIYDWFKEENPDVHI